MSGFSGLPRARTGFERARHALNSEAGFPSVSLHREVGLVFHVGEHDCRCVLVPDSDALTLRVV